MFSIPNESANETHLRVPADSESPKVSRYLILHLYMEQIDATNSAIVRCRLTQLSLFSKSSQ